MTSSASCPHPWENVVIENVVDRDRNSLTVHGWCVDCETDVRVELHVYSKRIHGQTRFGVTS